jgi:hypothetical protein
MHRFLLASIDGNAGTRGMRLGWISVGCGLGIVLGMFCATFGTHAALLAYDPANYPPVSALSGLNGGVGWNGPWAGNDNVLSGSLTINGVATNGNHFLTDGNNTGSFRLLDTTGPLALTSNGKFGKDGTTLWLSFLFRPESTAPTNYAGPTARPTLS